MLLLWLRRALEGLRPERGLRRVSTLALAAHGRQRSGFAASGRFAVELYALSLQKAKAPNGPRYAFSFLLLLVSFFAEGGGVFALSSSKHVMAKQFAEGPVSGALKCIKASETLQPRLTAACTHIRQVLLLWRQRIIRYIGAADQERVEVAYDLAKHNACSPHAP